MLKNGGWNSGFLLSHDFLEDVFAVNDSRNEVFSLGSCEQGIGADSEAECDCEVPEKAVHFILDGSFAGRFPHRRMPNLVNYWGLRAMIATERSRFNPSEGALQKSIDTRRHLFTFI